VGAISGKLWQGIIASTYRIVDLERIRRYITHNPMGWEEDWTNSNAR
jgi:hypothetical protein